MDYDMEDAINSLGAAIDRADKDAAWSALDRLASTMPDNLRVAFEERVAIARARRWQVPA